MKDYGLVIALWVGVGLAGLMSMWFIFAAMIQVLRGKVKPWQKDTLVAILFHAALAMLAVVMANQAIAFAKTI